MQKSRCKSRVEEMNEMASQIDVSTLNSSFNREEAIRPPRILPFVPAS